MHRLEVTVGSGGEKSDTVVLLFLVKIKEKEKKKTGEAVVSNEGRRT